MQNVEYFIFNITGLTLNRIFKITIYFHYIVYYFFKGSEQ